MISRRTLLARLAGSVALGIPAAGSFAQPAQGVFPARPVRVLTSGVVGGLTDSTARIAAERLAASTEGRGQPFVIDNRPGAGGVISMLGLLKSLPDGYTVKFADAGATSIAPALHSKPPYLTRRGSDKWGLSPFIGPRWLTISRTMVSACSSFSAR